MAQDRDSHQTRTQPADESGVEQHQSERLSHALYGLIIVTATLVTEQEHVTDVGDAIAMLAGVALVLLLAHTYAAWMAERTIAGGRLNKVVSRMIVLDNLPLGAAVLFPMLLFGLSAAGVMSLDTAYSMSIVFGILGLFTLGIYQGRKTGMGLLGRLLTGAGAAGIGLLVVAVEIAFE